MPLWFNSKAITPEQISIILAVPHLLRAVTGPIKGVWADQFRLHTTPMIWLGLFALLFYVALLPGTAYGAQRFWVFLIFWTLASSCLASIAPLVDTLNFQEAKREGFNYGLPRAVGSAAFVVVSIIVGKSLMLASVDIILYWVIGAVILGILGAAFVLHHTERADFVAKDDLYQNAPPPHSRFFERLLPLIKAPGFVLLLLAIGLIQAAHSFYYTFGSIIWKNQGISSSMIGLLWSVGVLAEIVFMVAGAKVRAYLGPWRLLALGGAIALGRWVLMMFDLPLYLLFLLQITHLFSFAATYMGGLELVQTLSPKGYRGLGQSLSGAYAYGVMMGLGTLASGPIFKLLGEKGYGVMAALAGAGFLIAYHLYQNKKRLHPHNEGVGG